MALRRTFRVILLLHCFQFVFFFANSEWVDMSHVYDNNSIVWGALTPFKHTLVREGKLNKDVPYFLVYDIQLTEHAGTHIDAPVHFAKGKWFVDQIPPKNLVGQAVVVNISAKASRDRSAELTVADLQKWEKEYGRIPDGSILLVFTDWGKYWPNREKYFGMDTTNTTLYTYPGIHGEAARWLVENRSIKGVGIDTISIDYGKSTTYPSHQVLYAQNIYGLENVANLDKLPPKGATIYVMPMNIKGGSGAPARIFANLPTSGKSAKNSVNVLSYLLIVVTALCFMY